MTNDDTPAANPAPPPIDKSVQLIGRTTAVLVAFLAIAAFGMSFEALRDLAIRSGVISGGAAWLFPLIIDGGIAVFSLAALRASLSGHDSTWFMSLVIVVTLISIGLNIAHAGKGWLPGTMAAMPPLLLFLAFESLMRQIRDTVGGPPVTAGLPKPARKSGSKHRNDCRAPSVESSERKSKVREMFASGHSRNRIAKELKIAPSTIRRYLADFDAAA